MKLVSKLIILSFVAILTGCELLGFLSISYDYNPEKAGAEVISKINLSDKFQLSSDKILTFCIDGNLAYLLQGENVFVYDISNDSVNNKYYIDTSVLTCGLRCEGAGITKSNNNMYLQFYHSENYTNFKNYVVITDLSFQNNILCDYDSIDDSKILISVHYDESSDLYSCISAYYKDNYYFYYLFLHKIEFDNSNDMFNLNYYNTNEDDRIYSSNYYLYDSIVCNTRGEMAGYEGADWYDYYISGYDNNKKKNVFDINLHYLEIVNEPIDLIYDGSYIWAIILSNNNFILYKLKAL